MSKKKYYDYWLFWIAVAVVVLVTPFIVKWFCVSCDITIFQNADSKSFYASYLSFAGTIWLGIVSIWQNFRLNQVNLKLQKQQLSQNRGLLFPEKCSDEHIAKIHPFRPASYTKELAYNEQDLSIYTLMLKLQNRGTDIIYKCLRIASSVNDKELSTDNGIGLLIELNEGCFFDWSFSASSAQSVIPIEIKTILELQNSAGMTYYQRYMLKFEIENNDAGNGTCHILAYNSEVFEEKPTII